MWPMPISGQVGGGLPVTGSSGPLADGEENLDRGKGVVGGPQAGNQTHRGHVPRLSTAFTLALHAYSHPAHGGGGFLPAAVMTTIGDEGTVLGDRIWGAEKGAVRRGSGAQGVAVSTGPAGVRKVGGWVEGPHGLEPGALGRHPRQASSSGSTLALGDHLPSLVSLGLPGGSALRPGASGGMSDVKGPPNRAPAQECINHVHQGQHSPN